MTRRITTILIIIAFLSPTLSQSAEASVLGTGTSFTSCAAGGFISNKISDGLNKLQSWATDKLKNWLGIGSLVSGGSVPVTDQKFINTYTGKENAQDIISRCAAREVLTKMGKDITNVARTAGRDGGPAYVRNWRNHETDAQYRGEEIFRNMLASTRLCNYFGNEVKNIFGVQGKKNLGRTNTRAGSFDSFQLSAGCTMPSGWTMEKYQNDFEGNGGWDAWNRLLEPQNNFYGILFKSLDESNKQRSLESGADINEVISGLGYTSPRGKNAADSCSVRGANGKCIVYKDIKTPGSTISGAVVEGIAAELQWVASTDELNELIATGVQVLINRLLDLSKADEGEYVTSEDPQVSISPFPAPSNCNAITEEEGAYARYAADTTTAREQFLSDNPEIADADNEDPDAMSKYLEGVAGILAGKGYLAGKVINCNGNVSSDSIYVGKAGDLYGDYFDMRLGLEGATIGESDQTLFIQWAGSERLVGDGGGGGQTESACLTREYKDTSKSWPSYFDSIVNRGGFANFIAYGPPLLAMITKSGGEVAILRNMNKPDAITSLEDLQLALDSFIEILKNAKEGDTTDRITIDRTKSSLKSQTESLLALPTCDNTTQ